MRLLHCIPTMDAGGAERQLCYLARGLVQRGHDVAVAYFADGPNSSRLRASGAMPIRLPNRHAFHPAHTIELAAQIRRFRPHLVQTWFTVMDFHAGPTSRVLGIPWVASERTTALELAHASLPRGRARLWLLRRLSSGIVANSTAGAEYWRTHLRPQGRVRVIENALPLDEIAAARPIRRAEMGVPADAELVLFVGRFVEEKDPDLLAAVVRGLLLQRPNAWFIACGDGHLRARFEATVADLGDRVKTLGFRPDIWSVMKSADVLVCTSYTEGEPNAVLEAAACGLPVALSDIRQHRAVLNDEAASFFARSAEEGIRALSGVLDDRDGARARAIVAARRMHHRTIAETAIKHEDFYRCLIGA